MAFESIQNQLLTGAIRLKFPSRAIRAAMLTSALQLAQANMLNQAVEAIKKDVIQHVAPAIAAAQREAALRDALSRLRRTASQSQRAQDGVGRPADDEKQTIAEVYEDPSQQSGKVSTRATLHLGQDGSAVDAPITSGQSTTQNTDADAGSGSGQDSETDSQSDEATQDSQQESTDTDQEQDAQDADDQEQSPAEVDPDAPTEAIDSDSDGQESNEPAEPKQDDESSVDEDAPTEKIPEQEPINKLGEGAPDTLADTDQDKGRSGENGEGNDRDRTSSSADAMPDTVKDPSSTASELGKAKNAAANTASTAKEGLGAAKDAASGIESAAGAAIPGTRMFLWEMMGTMFTDITFASFAYVHLHFIASIIKEYFDVLKLIESMGVPTVDVLEDPDTLQWVAFGVIATLEFIIALAAAVIIVALCAIVVSVLNFAANSLDDLFFFLNSGFDFLIDIFLAAI